MKIRNDYTFKRPLTTAEAGLLGLVIGWRNGSSIREDSAGQVVGCCAHPDDVWAFEKEVGKKIIERRASNDFTKIR